MSALAARELEVRPVSGAIGAEVAGVDLGAPLDDATVAAVRRALLDHLVLFFRDQRLTPGTLLGAARRFGEPSEYPFVRGLDEYPEIIEVVKREDEKHNFGGLWHSDTTYLEHPPLGSLLYAREIPPVGGDTLFANMYLAYEGLSDGMKRLLAGLVAVNSADKANAAITRVDRRRERPKDSSGVATTAEHPIVRTHPETGRKALYVNPGHTLRIAGMTEAESAPILEHLYREQTRPEYTCRLRWQTGTVAFWDNRAAQHYALNDYHGHRRAMLRVTLAGDRPV